MKRVSKLILFLMAFLFTSCSVAYNFANFNAEPIPFVSPPSTKSNDSTIISTSVGGKYTHSLHDANAHMGETNKSGMAFIYQTHTNKNFYFSYGCYGYSGEYLVKYYPETSKLEPYYGFGLSGEAGFNLPLSNIFDFHVLGIRGSVFYEDGQYANFRKFVSSIPENGYYHYNAYSSTNGYNISFTTGINYHFDGLSLGFEGGLGKTSSYPSTISVLTMNSTTYLTSHRFTFYLQYDDSCLALGEEYSLGFIYRLN